MYLWGTKVCANTSEMNKLMLYEIAMAAETTTAGCLQLSKLYGNNVFSTQHKFCKLLLASAS